jgi:hypothetical protein
MSLFPLFIHSLIIVFLLSLLIEKEKKDSLGVKSHRCKFVSLVVKNFFVHGMFPADCVAATVTTDLVTGNSVVRKMDLQGIAEAVGVCLGAITCAAIFSWFSSARNRS